MTRTQSAIFALIFAFYFAVLGGTIYRAVRMPTREEINAEWAWVRDPWGRLIRVRRDQIPIANFNSMR